MRLLPVIPGGFPVTVSQTIANRGILAEVRIVWVVWLLAAGCNSKVPEQPPAPLDLKGQTFEVAVSPLSNVRQALRQRFNDWEFRTESKVELTDAESANTRLWIGDGHELAVRTVPAIPESVLASSQVGFAELAPLYRLKFCRRGDTTVAIPLTTDLVLLWYRKDLFEDEQIAGRFREATGRALEVPVTWSDYLQVAEFFFKDDVVQYGCVEPMTASMDGARNFLVHCAAYAKGPNWSSFAIDTQTGKSRLDLPPFLNGLNDLLAAAASSPAADGVWPDEAQASEIFQQGKAAMLLARHSPFAGQEDPKFRVGVAALPGSQLVFDPRQNKFVNQEGVNRCVHFATTGSYVTLASQAAGDEAVSLMLQFIADKQESLYLVYAAREGALPVQPSLLNEPGRFAGYGLSPDATSELFQLVRQSLDAPNWVADIRTPQSPKLYESLGKHVQQALTKEKSPEDALKSVHQEWSAILSSEGAEFLNRFRQSLGLPSLGS